MAGTPFAIPNSVKRPVLEIVFVILTGALFVGVEIFLLPFKMPFLLLCVVGWGAYLVFRMKREPEAARRWGLRTDNLKSASLNALIFLIVVGAGILIYRLAMGWVPLPLSALVVLAVYPLWGFIQQFVVQGLIARNLEELGARRVIIVPVAALLFGLAHYPDWPLMALCAGAGLVWTALYFRRPNLIPLAFLHAWLGTLAYYWIFERDPWLEMFPG